MRRIISILAWLLGFSNLPFWLRAVNAGGNPVYTPHHTKRESYIRR